MQNPMHPGRVFYLTAIMLATVGCSFNKTTEIKHPTEKSLTAHQQYLLRNELSAFSAEFKRKTQETIDQITIEMTDPTAINRAKKWLSQLTTEIDEQNQADDPVKQLVDHWSFCVRVKGALTQADDRELFAPNQARIIAVLEQFADELKSMANRHFPDDAADMESKIAENAEKNPLKSLLAVKNPINFSDTPATFQWLTGRFRSVREIDPLYAHSQAIREVNETAKQMPGMVRQELEIYTEKLDARQSVQTSVESLERFSKASEKLANAVENAPEELKTALEQAETKQPEFRKTLADAKETTESVRNTVTAAEELAAAWKDTAIVVKEIVQEFKTLKKDSDTPAPEKPFDITEYKQTAEAMTQTTAELRALVADSRQFANSDDFDDLMQQVDERVLATLDRADTKTRGAIDHLAFRLAQLIGLIFILAVLYRVVSSRCRRPSSRKTE